MNYIGCLRNFDCNGNFNLSLWSKFEFDVTKFKFYDQNNNEYFVNDSLLSDGKFSCHFNLKENHLSDLIIVNVLYDNQDILQLKASKTLKKLYVISCDSPHKESKNMWENVHTDENTLTLHLGDQLYADIINKSAYSQTKLIQGTAGEWQLDCEKITVDNFFTGCGQKFMFGWHEFLWDDHEVDDGFRSNELWFEKWENHPHTEGAIKAYSQCQLGKNDSNSTRLITYNDYNFLFVDQRHFITLSSIKNGDRWLPENHQILIESLLNNIDLKKQLFVCISGGYHSTTPVTDLKVFLQMKVTKSNSEIDHGASSENAPVYSKLINILDNYEFEKSPIILGGDLHMAAIKDIISNKRTYKHLISSGVRSPTKNYEPILNKFVYFIERNFQIDNRLSRNIKVKTIYQSENKNIGLIEIKDNKIEISYVDEKEQKKVII
jgi:phosphodiesterase/alkaline phosphatase D-like protein